MKLNKTMKKVLAYVCAIALVASSMTVTNTAKTLAADGDAVAMAWSTTVDNAGTATFTDTSDDTGLGYTIEGFTTDYSWNADSKWQGQAAVQGITLDTSKYYKLTMNMSATASKDIVIQIADAPTYSFVFEQTVNTDDGTCELVFQPTAETVNLTIAFGAMSEAEAGTYDIQLSGITLAETEETTTPAETTTTEAPTQGEDGYTNCIQDANTDVGVWTYYVGSWAGASAKYKGGEALDDFSLSVLTNNYTAWGIQLFTDLITVTEGTRYKYSITLNSDVAGASVLLKEDSGIGDLQTLTLAEGDNVYEGIFTATDSDVKMFFKLDTLAAGTTVSITSFTLEETEEEEPTEAPTEAPTADADGFIVCTDDANTALGAWNYYVGSWGGSGATAKYKGGDTLDNFSLSVLTNGYGEWCIQAYTDLIPVTLGQSYAYKITLNSDVAGASVLLKEDAGAVDLETLTLVEGDNVFEGTFTANSDNVKMFFKLDTLAAGTTVSVTSFSLEEIVSEETTAVEEETTTVVEEETTTVVEEETTAVEEETTTVVVGDITIITQPQDITVELYEAFAIEVVAEGDGLTYQWQISSDGGATWKDSTSYKAKFAAMNLSMKAKYNGRMVRCVITDANGNTATSNEATVSLPAGPVIEVEPMDVTCDEGKSQYLTFTVSGEGLTYQWQMSSNGGDDWTNVSSSSATSRTLGFAMKTSYHGRMFRCVVTDANGNTATTLPCSVYVTGGPVITTQPASFSKAVGEAAAAVVEVTGTDLTYQWQMSSDNGATWTNLSLAGATTKAIAFTMKASYDGKMFRCVITDGTGLTVTTKAATVTLKQ